MSKYLKFSFGIFTTLVLLILFLSSWSIIPAGHRGVRLTFSAVSGSVAEGFAWKLPIVQGIVKMDVRVQKETATASAATKDLQNVATKIALNFHIEPEKVSEIYRGVGVDYSQNLISPVIQEAIKAATSRYTAEELITKRELVREDTKTLLGEKLSARGIIIDEFNIVDFEFSPQFTSAIEAKVTAEQNALTAKNKLDQVKFEAEQRVAQAKAEAEAIKIQAEAITQQGGDNYVQLQAIEKWDGKLPQQFIPGSALPFINLTK